MAFLANLRLIEVPTWSQELTQKVNFTERDVVLMPAHDSIGAHGDVEQLGAEIVAFMLQTGRAVAIFISALEMRVAKA